VAIDSTREDASKQVMELTRGRGVDVIIENVGTPQSMAWSLPLLKRRGRLVLVGYDPANPIPINAMQMHYNEWIITGSRTATKQDLLEVIDLVERKKIRPVVSKLVPWTEANEAIEGIRQRTGIGRTVMTF
jgi:D-arabinose 1-dehydrogenase-like Zn-dependent alcohol dehydrogenase